MASAYEKLAVRYQGSKLSVNECKLERTTKGTPYITIKFLEGKTLEEILDEKLFKNDLEGFHNLFDEYVKRISYGEEKEIADYDLIFENIMIEQDGNGCYDLDNTWNVIDCEWTFEKAVETKEIAFRAVYCYLLEDEKRNGLNPDLIMRRLEIEASQAEQYRRQEMKFQKYVTGKRLSMAEIREAIGQPVYTLADLCGNVGRKVDDGRVQIYEDTGKGFREEHSFFPEEDGEQLVRTGEGTLELSVKIPRGRSAVRIDPGSHSCVIYIRRIGWNGEGISLKGKQIQMNGFRVGEDTYAFPTDDPNITLSLWGLPSVEDNRLEAVMEVTRMSPETVRRLQKRGLFS